MLEGLTEKLTGALSFFRGRGKLTESNIEEGLGAVRQALLEADVNYEVAVDFTDKVKAAAVGQEVLKSLDPSQQFIGILYQELANLMGPVDHSLHLVSGQVSVIMMCGLQGSGKTTTCGKLAKLLLAEGKKPFLVAADLQRPAAIEQLKIIGQQLGVPVHAEEPSVGAVRVCQNGVAAAKKLGGINVVILDTAGRLHVDAELMQELEEIDRKIAPQQVLLVSDSMTGQDAVNSARAFNEALELDGVILTKLDGDTRGGAALSIKAVTGVPIKFVGMGEQLDKLEMFHPDRMAQRILGMGDVLTLFEKAQKEFDAEQAEIQKQKMMKGKFTLNDFKNTLQQIRKMGSIQDIIKMIPGMGGVSKMLSQGMDPDADLDRIDGIINSMTPQERENPSIIGISRRRRIADGSGCESAEINKLLKDFDQMASLMKNMAGMNKFQQMRMMSQMGDGGMFNPGAQLNVQKQRSERGAADKRAADEKKKRQKKDAKAQRKKNRR